MLLGGVVKHLGFRICCGWQGLGENPGAIFITRVDIEVALELVDTVQTAAIPVGKSACRIGELNEEMWHRIKAVSKGIERENPIEWDEPADFEIGAVRVVNILVPE